MPGWLPGVPLAWLAPLPRMEQKVTSQPARLPACRMRWWRPAGTCRSTPLAARMLASWAHAASSPRGDRPAGVRLVLWGGTQQMACWRLWHMAGPLARDSGLCTAMPSLSSPPLGAHPTMRCADTCPATCPAPAHLPAVRRRFVDDPELAYVITRARQVHDFWHVIFGCHTNAFGETALKAVEFVQVGGRVAGWAGVVVPARNRAAWHGGQGRGRRPAGHAAAGCGTVQDCGCLRARP